MGKEEGKKKQITESRLEEALRSRVSYFYEHAGSLNMLSVRRMLEEDLGIEKFALDVHRRFIKQFVEKNLVENSGENSESTAEVKEAAKDCEKDEKLKVPSSKAETGSREESSNETKVGVANVQNTDISESSIKKAILERADHFRANSKTLKIVSARRLLEGDLGLQINALDPFKKFISREVVEVVATAVASESSFDSSKDISGESRGTAPAASGSKEKSESRGKQKDPGQNPKGPGIKDEGQVEEDSSIMGLLAKEGDKVNAQGIETSESIIKQAILDQAHYFKTNAKTLTLGDCRRFLEEKLGLPKNALDPFKKFVCKQLEEVFDSPDVDVKKPNKALEAKKPKQSKRPRSPETETKSSKKAKKDATKKSAKKIDSDEDSESSKPKSSKKTKKDATSKSTKKIDSEDDSEFSEPKSSKKSKKDATRTSTKKIDSDEHLKSIIKACGMGKLRDHSTVLKMASYAQQPSSNLQYRCAMKGICKIFEKIHDDLRREHLDLLYKTPFKLLFKALYEKRICKMKRNDDVLDQIILSYNPKMKQFKIGKKYSKIYKSEIQLIFGIQDGKISVDNNKCSRTQTAFTERNFPGVKKVTAKMIKEQIIKVVVKRDEDSVQDTVRLLCLLLFQNWFFTTTGQVLGWTYVKYVEDLSKLNSYDWTYIIHKNLIDCLDEKSKSPEKVNGCTQALWYWFCERCKTIKPKEDEVAIPNDKDMEYKEIPRATKWVPSDLNKVFSKSKLSQFKEDEFSWNKLTPTKAELKLMLNTPKDKQPEQTQRHEKEEDDDNPDFEEPPPTKKCSNAAESSSRMKVKHTPKDKLSGKNKTQETEDDHDSAFQELTPKKKRATANAVESSSRKKGKRSAHNDDQENIKQAREIPQKTPEEDVDSSIQDNEIPQDPLQDIFQKVLKEYGNVNEKDQWLDSKDDNNQAVMDTLEALTETSKDLHNELEQNFETGEQREESHMMNTKVFDSKEDMVGNVTENTKSFVKVNQSTQTEDLDPREEELQRRELEIQILKSQVISLNSINDQLLKKMKQYEDKEKASNELAERAMEQVVSLKTKNEQHEKDKEEETKTLRTILNEIEAVVGQMQRELA